jgi:hypothetical protein
VDWGLSGLDAASAVTLLSLAGLAVLGDDVDTLNDDLVGLGEDGQNVTLLAAVSTTLFSGASDYLNQVALFNLCHELDNLRS